MKDDIKKLFDKVQELKEDLTRVESLVRGGCPPPAEPNPSWRSVANPLIDN